MIYDHPKGIISHKVDITGSFSTWIKIIYKWNMLLNEWLTDKFRLVGILSDLFSFIYSNSRKGKNAYF